VGAEVRVGTSVGVLVGGAAVFVAVGGIGVGDSAGEFSISGADVGVWRGGVGVSIVQEAISRKRSNPAGRAALRNEGFMREIIIALI
jgi:hypothetical protein